MKQYRGAPIAFLGAAVIIAILVLSVDIPAVRAQQNRRREDSSRQSIQNPWVVSVAGGKGRIDYNRGKVQARGIALLLGYTQNGTTANRLAVDAARADALRNLSAIIGSLAITTVRRTEFSAASVDSQANLTRLLQKAQPVFVDVSGGKTATVTLELPLYGKDSVASLLFAPSDSAANRRDSLSTVGRSNSNSPPQQLFPFPQTAVDSGKSVLPSPVAINTSAERLPEKATNRSLYANPLSAAASENNGIVTGLIIDCRGLGIGASLSPKLMDTGGRTVYDGLQLSAGIAVEIGLVGYPRTLSDAINGGRVGDHPLIIRALRADGASRSNPVISLEDADRAVAANNRSRFLERAAVVLLLDTSR